MSMRLAGPCAAPFAIVVRNIGLCRLAHANSLAPLGRKPLARANRRGERVNGAGIEYGHGFARRYQPPRVLRMRRISNSYRESATLPK
jgi:hypothetical protein